MDKKTYKRQYAKTYYYAWKSKYIALLGGKCKICNSTESLEFDHIDPNSKTFTITKLSRISNTLVEEELKKCQLLCKPCHRLKTIKEGRIGGGWNKGQLTHGSSGYKKGCRCILCVTWRKNTRIKK